MKLTCGTEEEWEKLKEEIDGRVAGYRGKIKEVPEVQVNPCITYYPKDGSFSFTKKEVNP